MNALAVITKSETSKSIKILWIIVLCASFFGLCFYIQGFYQKLMCKPEILVNEKHIPSFDIPFPAITICSPLNIKIEHANLSKIRDDVIQNKVLSPEDETLLARSAQVCQTDYRHFLKISKNKSYNEDILNTLSTYSNQINEEFAECDVDEVNLKCESIFIRSMTEFGYCFTFNMIGFNSMFNGNLGSEFDIYKRKRITKSWTDPTDLELHDDDVDIGDLTYTLDNGYLEESYHVQPLRAAKYQSVRFELKIRKIDKPNICEYHPLTYLLFIHHPVDIPSHLHHFTLAELNSYKIIQMSAGLKSLDDSLKNYSPKMRGCYFEDERKLEFFKSYSKSKCDFECMRNFTLTKCGCVKLSLLRTNDDKLCDVNSLTCYNEIAKSWPNSYYKDRKIKKGVIDFPCYCLPSCTQIKYDIVNEHSREMQFPDDEYIHSMVSIIFIESEIIETTNYVTYNLQNFIADIGGLAGLFLGFSLLSLFGLILNMMKSFKNLSNKFIPGKKNNVKKIQSFDTLQKNNVYRQQIRILNNASRKMDNNSKKTVSIGKTEQITYNNW